jgi:hypothetical protein
MSSVYSFDNWITVGQNRYTQVAVQKGPLQTNETIIYRSWPDPNSPININYEWPIYYALNVNTSKYQMTAPKFPVDLFT